MNVCMCHLDDEREKTRRKTDERDRPTQPGMAIQDPTVEAQRPSRTLSVPYQPTEPSAVCSRERGERRKGKGNGPIVLAWLYSS
jgi:hypothetical protein